MQPWRFYQHVQIHYSRIEELYNMIKKRFPDLVFSDLSPAIF
jgi:hypothetical protein